MSTALLVRSKKNGPVFLPDNEYGGTIASAIGSLDQIAASQNVPTIDSFTYMDPEILQEMIEMVPPEKAEKMKQRLREQQEWHLPAEGLKTIEALKSAVQTSTTPVEFQKGRGPHLRDALIEDLETVSRILSQLLQSGDSFRFEAA